MKDIKNPIAEADFRNQLKQDKMKTAEKAIELLKQYRKESGTLIRSTSDLSPLEQWLLLQLTSEQPEEKELKQRIKDANTFIIEIAKLLQIDTDGLGFDELQLNIDDFAEVIKQPEEKTALKVWHEEQFSNGYNICSHCEWTIPENAIFCCNCGIQFLGFDKKEQPEAEKMIEALEGLLSIVDESKGVYGYHLNGDPAEWDEFEEIVEIAKQAIK